MSNIEINLSITVTAQIKRAHDSKLERPNSSYHVIMRLTV